MSIWTELLGGTVAFEEIAGVRTRILRFGPDAGRPILLLHGRGGHLETFVRNIRAWAGDARPVIAFDLLGHGLTAQAGTRYDIGELHEHARAVRDLVAPGDHDLVGQSLGGWLAVLLAESRPPRRLVLIEPAGFQSEGERMADPRVRAASAAGGLAFDAATRENVEARFAQLLNDPHRLDPEMVDLRTELYAVPGAGAVHRAVRSGDNARWLIDKERFAALPVAPLIVRGARGHIPAETLRQLAEAPGGALLTIADAKQWPHYENPDAVNPAVIDYLKEKTA
ncbi:alpha/beta fold hydrolase [Herbiconiux ginsengi]|uniref:Pyruvate dehydrogenase E2 component (Dihydrolipoamide acetyltransferase) n=1 Tax=Herbiconiux ginsengi TaxID=381665 RepID=A0A1H3MR02_9MICO|nr:alpha/beta fold hydrolase [Herbiconiux ginsengi]SDY79026.1 pyruvate dehydrogenase E2 component (dihydrolipoamide acetyltransferase) [Herbiconiux ginsengi]